MGVFFNQLPDTHFYNNLNTRYVQYKEQYINHA